jgi:biotin carboxylase
LFAFLPQHKTRELMQLAGLPTPRHYRIERPADVSAAAAHVGFPAVIKPVNGAASIGVIRVNSEEELRTAYERWVGQDMHGWVADVFCRGTGWTTASLSLSSGHS